MIELFAAASVGLFAGTALTAAIAAKLYGWQRDAMDAPDADTYRRGYEAGRRAIKTRNAEVERLHNAYFST
jgi:hypothetical protein